MYFTHNRFFDKRIYLAGLILLVFISVISVAYSRSGSEDFVMAKREVLLRKIGDELLLQSGDDKSRVLPIKKIAENEYQISFENKLTFQPDSLVNITRRLLAKDPLAGDYVVNVLKCDKASVAYGFAISGNKKDDIVPCRGRVQPTECYVINIKLKPIASFTSQNGYILGSLPLLAFVGFIFLRAVKPQRTVPGGQDTCSFTLGQVVFNAKNRKLLLNGRAIDLTGTENRLLLIFASSPNETIERSRLQKEIWEDEGVIVGRSLDMFISKLRKKLELDLSIKIAVVRGKGYRLEISGQEKIGLVGKFFKSPQYLSIVC